MQAALFSAVLTAFVIESYQYMKPAHTNTDIILQKILVALQTNGQVPETVHTLDADPQTGSVSTFVRINALWFASLVTSVSTAFLAMLSKEWLADLHDGRGEVSTENHMRGRQIQLRYDSMHEWRLTLGLPFLPFLLHIALLLFFAGLVDFLWYFNRTVGIVAGVFVAGMVIIYVWTHLRSIFNATCPYRTSLTFLILIFANLVRKWLSLDLPAAIARIWVFIAVVAEGYWSYRDAELFSAIWDVLVASWFGRRWRALLATLADTHILPRNLWNLWARHIALGPTNIVRLREEAYISGHQDLMDARVLARMIGVYHNISDSSQLVRELCDFPSLIRHRERFIDAGAIDLLVHHLCHMHSPSRSSLLLQESGDQSREITFRLTQTLARLLTEAETSDNRTVQFDIENVPVLWDFRLRRVPKYIPFWYHPEESLIKSGLYQKDKEIAGFSTQDVVLFSHMLRLQLVVSSSNWYTQDVKRSVDQFFDCLLFTDAVNSVDDDALTALANATIFIGMRPVRAERSGSKQPRPVHDAESGEVQEPDNQEREMQAEHASNALAVLAAIMKKRPTISLPALRQIGWGIWMLSRPIPRSLSGLLVPTIASFDALAPALAGLLSPKLERNSVSDAVLILTARLLQSNPEQYDTDSDYNDSQLLLSELMERYIQYLRRVNETISEMKFFAKLTNLLGIDTQNWRSIPEIMEFGDVREHVSSDILLNSLSHIVRISALVWDSGAYSAHETAGIDTVEPIPSPRLAFAECVSILSATLDVLRATCEHLGRIKPASDHDIQDIYVLVVRFTCRAAIVYSHSARQSGLSGLPDESGAPSSSTATSTSPPTQPGDREGPGLIDDCYLAERNHDWFANTTTSPRDLATHIESALQAARQWKPTTKGSTDSTDEYLGQRIVNTLLASLALLKAPVEGDLDVHLGGMSTGMLNILRQNRLAEAAIMDISIEVASANLVKRVLEVIRGSVCVEGGIVDRRSSVSSNDHGNDTGILRHVHNLRGEIVGALSTIGHSQSPHRELRTSS